MLAIIGFTLGMAAVIVGHLLDHGKIIQLINGPAAFIVFGGTIGATLLSSSVKDYATALKLLLRVFIPRKNNVEELIPKLLELAGAARREGLIALDKQLATVDHTFTKHFLRQIVDGYDPKVLKEMMEDRISREAKPLLNAAKLYEAAGGYAPTIGIIGAVLGLIHVMSQGLNDTSKLGAGISVAFVATVYGVGFANIFLFPVAAKIRNLAEEDSIELELSMTALVGIQEGLNPRVIEDQLYNVLGQYKDEAGATASSSEGAQEKKAA